MPTVLQTIKHLNPCGDACQWADNYTDPVKAWAECERGDWMLWLIGKLSEGIAARKKAVLCACECVRLVLKHIQPNELRPLRAIETAESWARGDGASLAEVETASVTAYAASTSAVPYAAYAASAAASAAATVAYAADAANAAAYAANAAKAADAAARQDTLRQCADIVRKHYPEPHCIRA